MIIRAAVCLWFFTTATVDASNRESEECFSQLVRLNSSIKGAKDKHQLLNGRTGRSGRPAAVVAEHVRLSVRQWSHYSQCRYFTTATKL
uniref:Secreted protein n=1 Tax=Romanomermis culicivorax TaxID=13658 RepID=A0A915L5N1_ROMCU